MTALGGRTRRACGAFALALAGLVPAGSALDAFAQRRAAVLEEPDGTVVAVSLLTAGGGVREPDSLAGVSHVAALAVLEEVRPQLHALGADATATCGLATMRFTLLARPVSWRVATDILLEALFVRRIGNTAIDSARATALRDLEREEGNPEQEIGSVVRQALYGPGDRWARPDCGRPDAVAALRHGTVRDVARDIFRPSRTAVAVAGPVDGASTRRYLDDALGDTTRSVAAEEDEPTPAGGERRRIVERRTVTSWAAVAYPLPAASDPAALRLLGHELEHHFQPGPRNPDLLGIRTAIERHGGRGAFVVYLVPPAPAADAWTERVRARLERLADRRLEPGTFRRLLRRYRGVRLRSLASPEARARYAVSQVFYGHHYMDPGRRIEGLTAERLRRAAASLERPATAVIGPR